MPSEWPAEWPAEWPGQAIAHALGAAPTLGTGRLICIDGLAGAGKSTLATTLADATGAPLISSDELLEGWSGLPGLGATIERLLRPLATGQPSTWRRWDWHASAWAESHPVAPSPLLIVEGVGSGAAAYDDLITTLVWIEADREVRLARGLARDGEHMRPEWVQWLDDEDEIHARDRTRSRANLIFTS